MIHFFVHFAEKPNNNKVDVCDNEEETEKNK